MDIDDDWSEVDNWPDLRWYKAISRDKELKSERCPYRGCQQCPRYWKSMISVDKKSLAEVTNDQLKIHWQDNLSTIMKPPFPEAHRKKIHGEYYISSISNMCPEAVYDMNRVSTIFADSVQYKGEWEEWHDDPGLCVAIVNHHSLHYSECPTYHILMNVPVDNTLNKPQKDVTKAEPTEPKKQCGDRQSTEDTYLFYREDSGLWTITYKYPEHYNFINLKGFHYIEVLIINHDKSFTASDLYRTCHSSEPTNTSKEYTNYDAETLKEMGASVSEIDSMEKTVPDDKAVQQYKKELKRLERELALAKANKEGPEVVGAYETEIKILRNEIIKSRKAKPDSKHRSGITKAIKRAIMSMENSNHDLALHFKNAIKTGNRFKYSPDPSDVIPWNK